MSELQDVLKVRLTVRQATFDELLTHFNDARSTVNRGQSLAGGGDGQMFMPAVWNPTYRVLEKLLRVYRHEAAVRSDVQRAVLTRSDYWHLAEWYLNCRRFPQWPKKRTVQRGKELVEVQPPVVWRCDRHQDVDPRIVHDGLQWLEDEWTRSVYGRRFEFFGDVFTMGEPEAPDEFRAETSERMVAA